jgi:PAS domain S-box-containing protein
METTKVKILVVDDHKDNLMSLNALLSDFFKGVCIYAATSGAEGIEMALTHQPDVILLDIHMPGMDGFDVCKILKEDERLCDIPVVFVTALKENSLNKVRALELGAEGFLTKPIDENELIAHVKSMIKIKAANDFKKTEKQRLEKLVLERTQELQEELRINKEISNKLIESENHFRTLADSGQALIWTSALDKKCNYFNQPWLDFTGRSLEQELGDGWLEGVHPNDLQRCIKIYVNAFDRREKFSMDYRIRHKSGEYRWIQDDGTPRYNSKQEFIGYIGHCLDISERKKAEESLKLLKRAVASSSVSVVISDADGNIVYANPWFSQVTGYSVEEVAGRKLRILNQNKLGETDSEALWTAIRSGNDWSGEYQNRKKNGEYYWEKSVISPIFNKNGELANIISINEDITVMKKMVEKLIEAKEKAQESDRLKSAFLANMSHEIRTPMNGILGFTDLLLNPDFSSEEKEGFINIVHQSGQRMLNTVNNIIEISKIEAGVISCRMRETDINQRMKELVGFFQYEAEKKGLQLILEMLLPEVTKKLLTDQIKLDSILTNLIKNAIKYTESGTVTVGCRLKDAEIEFYVKDTGIGIPLHRQEAVFNRFEQADIEDRMALQGSGLGLAIAKSYVELLKGKLWVESEEGIGSTFYFTLPYNI